MIKLPNIFSNGMILAKKSRIWGNSDEKNIKITFLDQEYTGTTDNDGNFSIDIETSVYGGPYELIINDKIIKDVYVGRVYLCAGQSNMEQPLTRSIGLKKYIKPDIRIHAFQVEKGFKFGQPLTDTNAKWNVATGSFLQELFAVPYFFARKLLEHENTPIGLINVAAGGTPIEAWLPEEIIATFPDLQEKLDPFKDANYIKELENQGNQNHQNWFSDLKFDSDSPFKKANLLDRVIDTPGVVVYRKTLPFIEGNIKLNLGRAADRITVFINQIKVGEVGYQYPPAIFNIPQGVFQKDIENIIEIQLVGETQPAHFIPGKKYQLSHSGGTIHVSQDWLYKITHEKEPIIPSTWFYNIPTCCYNYMLAPILGYGIDGILWYQGESNTNTTANVSSRPDNYARLFELFVNHLRQSFGNVPIVYTQLANFANPGNDMGMGWPVLREQQRQCLQIENTAMAVAIDCGEYNDLHPADKKTVGQRLALLILNKNNTGPEVSTCLLQDETLTIAFDNADGLWAKNGRPILEIDEDRFAIARIEKNKLVAQVGNASLVRFGWSDCPSVTLYNSKNLPASPFEIKL